MEETLHPIIAIDGGAGTGKTTSAALVARKLGFCYVDSGAIYRAVALALSEAGIAEPGDPRIGPELSNLPLRIEPGSFRFRVFLASRELGEEIRRPEISQVSSKLAVHPGVRRLVTRLLRDAGRLKPMVVEGRDIGTVVFPDAVLKVFLKADLSVRATRRRGDLERQGIAQSVEQVADDLAERDARDTTRAEAPLLQAEGALIVDTSKTDIEGQVAAILEGFSRVRSA